MSLKNNEVEVPEDHVGLPLLFVKQKQNGNETYSMPFINGIS